MASTRKSFDGSKHLPFKNDGGHCVLGDLQCCRHFLVPFPRSVPCHNPVLELYGHFLQPLGLVFTLTFTVNCGTLYGQVCAFLNPVQSFELTTGGLQSSCRNISRMINGNRIQPSQITTDSRTPSDATGSSETEAKDDHESSSTTTTPKMLLILHPPPLPPLPAALITPFSQYLMGSITSPPQSEIDLCSGNYRCP